MSIAVNRLAPWQVMRHRPVLAASIFALAQIVAAACWFSLPHHYKADAVVLLDASQNPVQIATNDVQANLLASRVGLLSSRLVAERVIKRLGLDRMAVMQQQWAMLGEGRPSFETWLENVVLGGLIPRATPGSSLVTVSYASPSPEMARAMANAFAEELAFASDQLNRGVDLFAGRAYAEAQEQARSEMRSAHAELAQGSSRAMVVDVVADPDLRAHLQGSNQTSNVVGAFLGQEAINQVLAGKADPGTLLDDAYLLQQRERLSALRTQRAEAVSSMGDQHPIVRALDASTVGLEADIRRYEQKRRASQSTRASGMGQAVRSLQQDDARKQAALLVREQQRQALVSAQQKADLSAERYEDALTQAELTELLKDAPRGDVRVISLSGLPASTWFPSLTYFVPVSVGMGLLLAWIGAYASERRDRRVRSVDELQELVGAPLLGRLGRR